MYNVDINSKKERMKMIGNTKFGPIGIGYDFEAVRKDGREFVGQVEKVVETGRGTLVTIMNWGETSKEYKNIYLEECDFTVSQPHWV